MPFARSHRKKESVSSGFCFMNIVRWQWLETKRRARLRVFHLFALRITQRGPCNAVRRPRVAHTLAL